MSSLTSNEISALIDKHTVQGNNHLAQAAGSTDTPHVAKDKYGKAIKEFVSAYKCALLLNSNRHAEIACAFNLGVAHVSGGDTRRGMDVLYTVLDKLKSIDLNKEKNGDAMESNVTASPRTKADVHYNLAIGYEKLGDPTEAIKSYEKALNEYSSLTNMESRMCDTHMKIGNLRVATKMFLQAQISFSAASRIYLSTKDYENGVLAMLSQANAAISDCNVNNDECKRILEIICKECKNIESREMQGKVLCEVGLLYSALGHLHHALVCFEACVKLSKHDTNQTRHAVALQNAGVILNRLRDFEHAAKYLRKAAMLHGQLGTRNAQGQCFCTLGFALSRLSLITDSCEAYNHALQAALDCDDKEGLWQSHEGLGIVYYMQDNLSKAEHHLKASLAAHAHAKNPSLEVQDRIIKNLMNILKLSAQNEAMQFGMRYYNKSSSRKLQAIEYGNSNQLHANSTGNQKDEENKITEVKTPRNEGQVAVVTQKKVKTKSRKRGKRREYEDNQPIHHVARGISNLTQSSLDSYGIRKAVHSPDSSSDESGGFWRNLQNFIKQHSSSDEDVKQKTTIRKALHEVADNSDYLARMPLKNGSGQRRPGQNKQSLLEMHEEKSEDRDQEENKVSTKLKESPEDMNEEVENVYKKQLLKAEESSLSSSESDLTSVTSRSSKTERNDGAMSQTMPLTPPSIPPTGTDEEMEPIYAQSLKTLKMGEANLGQSTHIYETLTKKNDETEKIDESENVNSPIYDDVPDTAKTEEPVQPTSEVNNHSNSEEEMSALSSKYHRSFQKPIPQNQSSTSVFQQRQKNDPLPEPPKHGKKSGICAIM